MASDKRTVSVTTIAQLLAGMALFGTATPLSKIIASHYSVFTASFLRMVIASLVLSPFVWLLTDRFSKVSRSDLWVICGIAAVGMVGFTTAMLFGMRMTTGVIGSTIMSATPAVTAAAAILFLGASINWRKAGALGLSLLGVLAINLLGKGNGSAGDALVFGAALVFLAVCFEAAYTLLSRKLSKGTSSLEATLAATLIAAPMFLVLALVFDPEPFDFSQSDATSWLAVVFWGAAAGGLAPVLWYRGVRVAPGVLTAGAMSVMPLTALALSYWLLGEAFRWVHLLGFGLVFLGLTLMIIEHAHAE